MSKRSQALEILEASGAGDWLTGVVSDTISPYIPRINQEVSQKIQNLTTQLLASKSEELLSELPNSVAMGELGRSIGLHIVQLVNNQILPQVFGEISEISQISGYEIPPDQRLRIYNQAIALIPQQEIIELHDIIPKLQFTIHPQDIVKNSLTFEKFNKMVDSLLPFVNNLTDTAKDGITHRVKSVATLGILSSFILGGVSTYAFIKLYNSIGK